MNKHIEGLWGGSETMRNERIAANLKNWQNRAEHDVIQPKCCMNDGKWCKSMFAWKFTRRFFFLRSSRSFSIWYHNIEEEEEEEEEEEGRIEKGRENDWISRLICVRDGIDLRDVYICVGALSVLWQQQKGRIDDDGPLSPDVQPRQGNTHSTHIV